MKPQLYFTEICMEVSDLGYESILPDILGEFNIQAETKSALSEYEEIYEGYGKLSNIYPYTLQNTYNRRLQEKMVPVAILENDYLKATFLPSFGGRLWSLIDKTTGCNLLYTNDVIRPSNLALRNAWFSGGVEWNIGVIGHCPFTMSPLFTAKLTLDDGITPVLRFYEFERIRKVAFQIDFWLESDSKFLNCRMRIHNQNHQVIPMYWWSNMAVPEYNNGRVVVPASMAYTSTKGVIHKVTIPYVENTDITNYNQIPAQVDYFFDIPEEEQKYIANINEDGYGLLQVSTKRLKGRKLFSWGTNEGSERWQEFLTKNAGRYIEIQAGLGKTQYGCIPMAPNTAWEWLEKYGAIQISKDSLSNFSSARAAVDSVVKDLTKGNALEEMLLKTRPLAKTKGTVIYRGSGYGRLENLIRKKCNLPPLSPHLDFDSDDKKPKIWEDFLDYGFLPCPDPGQIQNTYILDDFLYQKLKDYVSTNGSDNWYAYLHLGFQDLYHKRLSDAGNVFLKSDQLWENPWAKFGLAEVCRLEGRLKEAVSYALDAVALCNDNLSYVKVTFKLLNNCRAYGEIKKLYLSLPDEIARDSRIKLYYIIALKELGKYEEAYTLLTENGGLIVDDIREGEDTIGSLWLEIYHKLYPEGNDNIPHIFRFNAF